ncbi:T6SS immunity protein Tdi1 domain-containing protein [Arthrobacter sp. M4]|uniref:T6SS immunity protein Tdi1 domain-containing protein n=1 Tax=Arthrobacter sp. M4 TaxID=218160 RepID=UPI001CDCDE18|nr:T6SS immunity protein Tdi1 domain-containing protein [Arthrobacter sp. M4]MCA4135314.1 DUF1851 domain-containing protein [Arthrobacter sp. M4]
MEPLRRFPLDLYAAALDSWSFLDFDGKSPVFTSPFGDVFFQASNGFWFLDVLGGELRHLWANQDELNAELNSRSGQDEYLMLGLASQAESSGLHPGEGEVYSFRVPPVLGGVTDIDNVEVSDFVVALDIAGQIHKQVLTLPPGTPISGISLS